MTIQIDKNVPIPSFNQNSRYPWNDLQVGDSFFVETDNPASFIRNVYAKNRDGKKFVSKKMDGGVRVWRIA